MSQRQPEVFYLIATSQSDPTDVRTEEFWQSVYQHPADRYVEASRFVERMHAQGFQVEYSGAPR
ncbi:hypothetical protein N9478_07270 [Gammaproteobacteria bacterium]|nr:hypothetical protein [Gammaproteobacteria bacterium]